MASRRKLDSAGRSARVKVHAALGKIRHRLTRICANRTRGNACRLVTVLLVIAAPAMVTLAFSDPVDKTSDIKQLVQEERWQEVVQGLQAVPSRNADQNYYYGLALAQLGRYPEAEQALRAGRRQQPRDPRFPVELAGVAFKQKKYGGAEVWLRRALKLDPTDAYSNDFLATVYFLRGNLEAALKYWNRVGKPRIENVTEEPHLKIDAALLDRAFAFAPASVLRLSDLLTSEARVEGLGIFPVYKFQLDARPDENFDVTFRGTERDGWGANKWDGLLSTFRGVFYQTICAEYFNRHGSATNFTSLLRWDQQKRRALATVSGPLGKNPKFRYAATVDLRNENWNVLSAFKGPATLLGALNMRHETASGQIFSFNSGSWGWSTGMELSHRDYRSVFPGSALTPGLLLTGFELKQVANVQSALLRVPERRFVLQATGSEQAARIWSAPSESFLKLEGSLHAHWFPRGESRDYELEETARAGKTFGQVPFDELFMLGLERDNDLPLRAHIGTRDGRKGSAPLGRNYFLSNWEINKNVYDNGLIGIRLSPFLDMGKITDPIAALGSHRRLFDTGMQLKFRVLTVGLVFTYGKDLRSGTNAFYFAAQ